MTRRQAIAAARAMLRKFGVDAAKASTMDAYRKSATAAADIAFVRAQPKDQRADLLDLLDRSKAQLRQDLFVLAALDFKRGGYFVEFGATDGVGDSNTNLLETGFDWTGLLAEPARSWHAALRANRKAAIETDCVWKETGATLTFAEVDDARYSTVGALSDKDLHAKRRKSQHRYDVKTISLNDMLEKHNAPDVIDYLSIDTEGSEYEILSNFDFKRRRISIITCEHNYTPDREKIHALLTGEGYVRKYEDVSQFDDWYVHAG